MNQLSVDAPRSTRSAPENPADALAAVVDNATALARAELRLMMTEARVWLVRAGLGLGLLWLSLLLFQVLALLVAASPLLLLRVPWENVALALALSLLPALVTLGFAVHEWHRLKGLAHAKQSDQR